MSGTMSPGGGPRATSTVMSPRSSVASPRRLLADLDTDDLRADRADQAAVAGRLVEREGQVVVAGRDAVDGEPAVRVQRDEVGVQGLEEG